jgi:hypothetical protein
VYIPLDLEADEASPLTPGREVAQKIIVWSSNVKNERTNVPILFLERNQNILVSFPSLSYGKQIVSIWSKICSPRPNRNDLFR